MPSSVFGIDDRVEKEGDEIRKVIGVKMREQQMRNLVPVHSGLDQVHQSARAKIEQNVLICAHQIPGRGTRGVDIGPGTKNGESHRQHTGR